MLLRPNRVQPTSCHAAVAAVLGEATAGAIIDATGIAALPAMLPGGPRDLNTLSAELQPFVALYREVERRAGRAAALAVARRAIIDSGLVSHTADADAQAMPALDSVHAPLTLTSPPQAGFHQSPGELDERFALAMRFFSCEGTLLEYTAERVHFRISGCNWCRAMQAAGAPELIPFFCETDEHFMDQHATHRLVRPTAIGLGDTCCDFQFVPISDKERRA